MAQVCYRTHPTTTRNLIQVDGVSETKLEKDPRSKSQARFFYIHVTNTVSEVVKGA